VTTTSNCPSPSRENLIQYCKLNSEQKSSADDIVESLSGYLNSQDASALDVELMSQPGFSLEQLMELAGLSVAEAVYQAYPPSLDGAKTRVILVCGPGNNGGDGLVAARHLTHFGYDCVLVYPKRSSKTHFVNLVQQCIDLNIPILENMQKDWRDNCDVIVDAVFGFSFKGEPREPYASILKDIQQSTVPVVSVDVPSGWDVDEGDVSGTGFMPGELCTHFVFPIKFPAVRYGTG